MRITQTPLIYTRQPDATAASGAAPAAAKNHASENTGYTPSAPPAVYLYSTRNLQASRTLQPGPSQVEPAIEAQAFFSGHYQTLALRTFNQIADPDSSAHIIDVYA